MQCTLSGSVGRSALSLPIVSTSLMSFLFFIIGIIIIIVHHRHHRHHHRQHPCHHDQKEENLIIPTGPCCLFARYTEKLFWLPYPPPPNTRIIVRLVRDIVKHLHRCCSSFGENKYMRTDLSGLIYWYNSRAPQLYQAIYNARIP